MRCAAREDCGRIGRRWFLARLFSLQQLYPQITEYSLGWLRKSYLCCCEPPAWAAISLPTVAPRDRSAAVIVLRWTSATSASRALVRNVCLIAHCSIVHELASQIVSAR